MKRKRPQVNDISRGSLGRTRFITGLSIPMSSSSAEGEGFGLGCGGTEGGMIFGMAFEGLVYPNPRPQGPQTGLGDSGFSGAAVPFRTQLT